MQRNECSEHNPGVDVTTSIILLANIVQVTGIIQLHRNSRNHRRAEVASVHKFSVVFQNMSLGGRQAKEGGKLGIVQCPLQRGFFRNITFTFLNKQTENVFFI